MAARIEKLMEILGRRPPTRILWHDLEDERAAIEKGGTEAVSVWGGRT
jgi:hypothetical protein